MNLKEEYKNFVESYEPFLWEYNKFEIRADFKNQHTFEQNFIRYFFIFKKLKELKNYLDDPKIIDVGSYPGSMIKLSKKVFVNFKKYISIGLDLNQEFIDEVKKFNVDCIDTEIDPQFLNSKKQKKWNLSNYNLCLLLDTIEHLVNPIYCLDQINNSLQKDGYLLITTDNITNIKYIKRMMLKGESPNVNYVLSSLIYKGNHRPHHREFSKNELEFLLNYSGFKILQHEYFDREQAKYFLKNKKLVKKFFFNPKLILSDLLNKFFNLVPHFRNHQIILAQKVNELSEVERFETNSTKEWLDYRLKKIGY